MAQYGHRTRGFRSKFERRTAEALSKRNIDYEYESVSYEYYKLHTYTPDFKLPNGIFVETKGLFLPSDRAKILLVMDQHPDLDLRMVFMVNKTLNKRSRTTYGDWCDKHDIPWAIGSIPQEWLDE